MTSLLKRFTLLGVASMAIAGTCNAQAEAQAEPAKSSLNGFAVWAEGSGCDRELQFNKIINGVVGEKKTAVERGIGADIWVTISPDGEWIAFGRAKERWNGKYGICDYHDFHKFDLYIAHIANGKNLPAEAIRVDHGYWPTWSDQGVDPTKPKTLYYTRYDDQTIRKAVINPDGTIASKDEIFAQCPVIVKGGEAHTRISPDGKFIAYRPGKIKIYSIELQKDISGNLQGCSPSWCPRSKYFIRAQNTVFYNTGTSVNNLGNAGMGKYWYGFSNDAYFDEGKLWVIGKMGGGGQNDAGPVEFKEVDITDGGWKVGPGTVVGQGTSADIHIYSN